MVAMAATSAPVYDAVLASQEGKPIRTTCGFEIRTKRLDRLSPSTARHGARERR
jgi:hypothetical protein